MTIARRLALLGLAAVLAFAGAAAHATSSQFCDRAKPLTASQQDRVLRFTAVVQQALSDTGSDAVLISRSGLDLSRFRIRYSHTAIAWKGADGTWLARQLYYACDEGHPRLYDQGLAGFVMGIDDATLGYVSIVSLPAEAARALRQAALDTPRALRLLAARYSANAYPFSLRYQNCNQWVMELLAVAWGDLPDGDDLRERSQQWLRAAPYRPEPVDVGSHALIFASNFVPLIHLDDHPEEDIYALKLRVSLPSTVEAFVREQRPGSERVELCHDSRQVVMHRGWEPISDNCRPAEGDRVVLLD
ncbi:MAG TPA: DUF2145 domain-containing protein [Variovorax sp.]